MEVARCTAMVLPSMKALSSWISVPFLAAKRAGMCWYFWVKSTFFLRSSVMSMVAMMASYLRDSSAGMMPSQSCLIRVHFTFISSHRALAMSMSKPFTSPLGSVQEKGG